MERQTSIEIQFIDDIQVLSCDARILAFLPFIETACRFWHVIWIYPYFFYLWRRLLRKMQTLMVQPSCSYCRTHISSITIQLKTVCQYWYRYWTRVLPGALGFWQCWSVAEYDYTKLEEITKSEVDQILDEFNFCSLKHRSANITHCKVVEGACN